MSIGRNTRSGLAERHLPPRTVCKICWTSVYPDDATSWVTSPAPGIAHTKCTQEPTTKD